MIRNLKALGLALFAILAMGAMMASAAQAQGKFTWGSGTQEITAEQDGAAGSATAKQQFHTTTGNVECEEVTGSATVTGTEATEVESKTIKYQNVGKVEQCNGPLGTHPKIEFTGCQYLFTAGETIGQSGLETTGQVHILCPVGKQITITSAGCQIHVPAQTPTGGHLIYHTVQTSTPDHVTIEATVTGIHYQGTELCSSGIDGTYNGNVTLKAYNGTTHNSTQQKTLTVE